MAVASLGYRTDLMLLGLQGSVVEQRAGYQVIRTADNPEFYWGNFLLLDGPPEPGTISFWLGTFAREFPTPSMSPSASTAPMAAFRTPQNWRRRACWPSATWC